MSIRFHSIRAFIPAVCLLSALSASAQTTPAPQTTPAAPAPASKEPDYPDPRRLFVGMTALSPLESTGPDIRGGVLASQAGAYESLQGLGTPYRFIAEFEAGIPVTRTGMLYAEFERYHGSGAQVLPQASLINGFNYAKGDQISSNYAVLAGRVYLDDLLWPHKFPVSRFRLKSIWGIRIINLNQATVSATEDLLLGAQGGSVGIGSSTIYYPEFGLGMEYALSKHTLFHIDGEGFAIPHRSTIGEGSATLSFRLQNLEVLMGVKALHFKTSPQKEEYVLGTFVSPFVGLRWYF